MGDTGGAGSGPGGDSGTRPGRGIAGLLAGLPALLLLAVVTAWVVAVGVGMRP